VAILCHDLGTWAIPRPLAQTDTTVWKTDFGKSCLRDVNLNQYPRPFWPLGWGAGPARANANMLKKR
jgi:hypothetical protein